MAKTLARAGQVNMRGKRSRLRHCGCCVCRDLRADILGHVAMREAASELTDPTNVDDGGICVTINDADYYV